MSTVVIVLIVALAITIGLTIAFAGTMVVAFLAFRNKTVLEIAPLPMFAIGGAGIGAAVGVVTIGTIGSFGVRPIQHESILVPASGPIAALVWGAVVGGVPGLAVGWRWSRRRALATAVGLERLRKKAHLLAVQQRDEADEARDG